MSLKKVEFETGSMELIGLLVKNKTRYISADGKLHQLFPTKEENKFLLCKKRLRKNVGFVFTPVAILTGIPVESYES